MRITVLSLGAGVQSTTLALMAVEGVLPKPDAAIFADTGWEPKRVYSHLDKLADVMGKAGIALHRGMGRRQCTSEYKLSPINRKVRGLLGAPCPDYRRVPRGNVAEQWIGFSADEVGRVNSKRDVSYVEKRYPLIEMGMTRRQCENWLNDRGWPMVAKSACIGCPYHGNAQWRDLRDNHPDEWADAVAFDEAIRKGGARGLPLNGEAFLHRSRVPLSIAPIDRRTRSERRGEQLDLLDEFGDPDGCSPYGCRSGEPLTDSGDIRHTRKDGS